MPARNAIREEAKQQVLLQSKRRCPLCFVTGDTKPQSGMIAHIDRNSADHGSDNLVYLCARHHLEFDQGDTLKPDQIRDARRILYETLAADAKPPRDEPRAGYAYEDRVVDLVRSEVSQRLGDFFALSRTALCLGRSGVSHEVDLAVEFSIAGLRYSTVFEIKHRRSPLGAEDVLRFAAVAEDIGASKAVIVCNGGYSAAAVKLARAKGISLMHVRTDPDRLEDVHSSA